MNREKLENKYNNLKQKVYDGKKEAKLIEPAYLTHKFANWFEKQSDNKQLLFYHGFFVCFLTDTISLPFVFVANVAKQIANGVKNSVNKGRLKKLEKIEKELEINTPKERALSDDEQNSLNTTIHKNNTSITKKSTTEKLKTDNEELIK